MAKRNGPRNFQDGPELGLRIWYLGRCDIFALSDFKGTLPETNISPEKAILKMIFLFQRWDMLVLWRVLRSVGTTKTGSGVYSSNEWVRGSSEKI